MSEQPRDMPSRVARPFVFLAKLLAWDREAWITVGEWLSDGDGVMAAEKVSALIGGNLTSEPLPDPEIPLAQFGSSQPQRPVPPENIVYREGREIPRPPPPPRPSEDLNPVVKVRL